MIRLAREEGRKLIEEDLSKIQKEVDTEKKEAKDRKEWIKNNFQYA